MFKSLDSIASVVGIFMYLTISKFKQVLRSRKGLGKVSTTTLVSAEVNLHQIEQITDTMKEHREFGVPLRPWYLRPRYLPCMLSIWFSRFTIQFSHLQIMKKEARSPWMKSTSMGLAENPPDFSRGHRQLQRKKQSHTDKNRYNTNKSNVTVPSWKNWGSQKSADFPTRLKVSLWGLYRKIMDQVKGEVYYHPRPHPRGHTPEAPPLTPYPWGHTQEVFIRAIGCK